MLLVGPEGIAPFVSAFDFIVFSALRVPRNLMGTKSPVQARKARYRHLAQAHPFHAVSVDLRRSGVGVAVDGHHLVLGRAVQRQQVPGGLADAMG